MWPHLTLPVFGTTLTLPFFGLMMVLSVLGALLVTFPVARTRGMSNDQVLDLALVTLVGGVVGARVLGLLVEWRAVLRDPLDALWYAGGLHFYGGFLGGLGAMMVWARRAGQSSRLVADVLTPGLLLGQAFGRIGCIFQGCCYGCVWLNPVPPLGLVYPGSPGNEDSSPAYWDHLAQGLIHPQARHSLETVPVPLMEAALCGILFLEVFQRALRKSGPTRPASIPGHLACGAVAIYAVARFGLEFFRGDGLRGVGGGLSTSQWIALGLLPLALGLHRRWASHPEVGGGLEPVGEVSRRTLEGIAAADQDNHAKGASHQNE
jgi:phosphatidylglycerol:prolipoprotein diacylglycerol transferase